MSSGPDLADGDLSHNDKRAGTVPAHLALVTPYLGAPVDALPFEEGIAISSAGPNAGNAAWIVVEAYTDAGEAACAGFRPTEEALVAWLNDIRMAPERFLVNDLYSPCKLTGQIVTRTGAAVAFSVQSSGIGTIDLSKGETVVFAPPGWSDPNAGLYFNSGE
ncbi:hypothetical protein [Candidatus Thiosymbion oneisti]|uniref:hypothetical protein n=1 Tax=Candidatus Thiosymbion oneisti TaxID=589554 RepID=UPI00105D5D69|nr:hypothetical protein [Candidatus Thiosymbion oneisti]